MCLTTIEKVLFSFANWSFAVFLGEKINAIMAGVGFKMSRLKRSVDFVSNLNQLTLLITLLTATIDQKRIRVPSILMQMELYFASRNQN